jgi:peptidoglycan hydrolase-like protein with peptidoglycan-binding domain
MLQKFLNCSGFVVSATGPGSFGNETDKIGPATVKAVKSLQKKYGLKADGVFGAKTRAVIGK